MRLKCLVFKTAACPARPQCLRIVFMLIACFPDRCVLALAHICTDLVLSHLYFKIILHCAVPIKTGKAKFMNDPHIPNIYLYFQMVCQKLSE